jgi:predicted TIM-barrel fold metal-dependent hydrolase
MIDVAAWIGPYPFRELPHPDPDVLVRVLERERLSGAWVGYLPAAWQRDQMQANRTLFQALAPYPVLRAAPTIRPDWPRWEQQLDEVVQRGAAAIRVYPRHWQLGPYDVRLHDLVLACAERGLPVVLTVRFEDLRQRSDLDTAGDLPAVYVRALARLRDDVRLVVTGAGREMMEEAHGSLTPDEQRRVYWDFAWVWGPPEDHFAHLLRTMGAERFVYGTHWPLRLVQNSRANLDLLPDDVRGPGITDASQLALRT